MGGNGTVTVYDQSNDASLGPYDLLLIADGHYLNQNSAISVLMRRTSYSKYAYFTNTEPSNIYFVTSDSLKALFIQMELFMFPATRYLKAR